jgi:hypothetical protein
MRPLSVKLLPVARLLALVLALAAGGCATEGAPGPPEEEAAAEVASTGQPEAEAVPSSGPPDTDIIVFEIYPHLDHVHVGSLVRVTERAGYDNQPFFLDEDRLLFTSVREGDQADIHLFRLGERALERVTATPESEYSPRPTPDGTGLTVVRVELDGVSQHLHRYPLEEGRPGAAAPAGEEGVRGERFLPGVDDIGYYAWAGDSVVALFRLGDPPSLHLADLRTGEVRHVLDSIGPMLQSIPDEDAASFVDRSDPERPLLRRVDGVTGEVTTLAELPPGAGEHAWMSSATVLLSHEGVIYRLTGSPEAPWHPIVDLGELAEGVTRIAISPSGRRIAAVVTGGGG